jgi:hypothetical protein
MKKLRILLGILLSGLICVGYRCGNPDHVEVEPGTGGNVYVSRVQDIDNCTRRYFVSFSDGATNAAGDVYWYWVGLAVRRAGGGWDIVAHNDGDTLTPPFSGGEMSVDLTSGDDVPAGADVYAIAVKTNSSLYVGDVSIALDYGLSEEPVSIPTFPQDCCDFAIRLTSDGDFVGTDPVYISSTPGMPQLVASVEPGTLSPTGNVEWSLMVSYTRSGRNDRDTVLSGVKNALSSWNINSTLGSMFRGGQATLKCRSHELNCSRGLDFCIRAYNPEEAVVEQWIATRPGVLWYWKYVAMWESDFGNQGRYYAQFNTSYKGFYSGCSTSDPNAIEGTPNASGDGGFGIYQLTNFTWSGRAPNAQELWNWKQNVASGTGWLQDVQWDANSFMGSERAQAEQYLQIPYNPEPPDCTEGNVTFRGDGTGDRPIEHAVAIKRYNGNGGSGETWRYCWFFKEEGHWDTNPLNDRGENYVNKVCSLVE